ncbi:AraC family transcriptional regulator [Paenibacillus allorhizosphaerae]|uniref:HTH-type transcriptional activator RhaR n=1 Tax=Paenibacillus allorhizosphaerae TaxID=2849866 RepID=A0ABN7TFC1_9BACL|nr:AraC family transcriptional regulator [Paenibacillus allorhizosphaerae]CAG7626072.1 HTH-type transcriptional activator RhaR [Paenibacillus allorhizosphaerae]
MHEGMRRLPFSDDLLQNRQFRYKYRHLTKEAFKDTYHYHRGIEILFVHQGNGQLVLNNRMYPLNSGCIIFIQPFQLHRVHFEVSDECPYERSVLIFEPLSFVPYLKLFSRIHRFFEHMWKDDLNNQVFRMNHDKDFIIAILERLYKEFPGRAGNDNVEDAAPLLIHILDYLHSLNEDSYSLGMPRKESHVEKVLQWVEEHYPEPFNLDVLAEELHLSKHHISHLFRKKTGSSITDYLIARRIRQACWLLETETISLEQIGSLVGIPNYSYFCRIFKKNTGLTPNQYRNNRHFQ